MRFSVETTVLATPPVDFCAIPDKRLARVLLADSSLPSRLAIKSILSKAGYAVTGAASAAEARTRLDESEYELVLADLRSESEEAGPRVLEYARQKCFRPATIAIEADLSDNFSYPRQPVSVSNEDVCMLLDRVASVISQRADRRMRRG
jgi:CheY-like chemotaxis protein